MIIVCSLTRKCGPENKFHYLLISKFRKRLESIQALVNRLHLHNTLVFEIHIITKRSRVPTSTERAQCRFDTAMSDRSAFNSVINSTHSLSQFFCKPLIQIFHYNHSTFFNNPTPKVWGFYFGVPLWTPREMQPWQPDRSSLVFGGNVVFVAVSAQELFSALLARDGVR